MSIALAATTGLIIGYLIGCTKAQTAKEPIAKAKTHPPSQPAPKLVEPVPELPAPPDPELAAAPDKPDEPADEGPPLKILAAPEAALKAFLLAPDWHARLKHVANPEEMAEVMKGYYAEEHDGPINPLSVAVQESRDDSAGVPDFYIYLVTTGQAPEGFPVAVMNREGGWKVDWGSFVEFHDDHFSRFAGGQAGDKGAFHLLVRITNFAPKREGFTAFRLDPPLPDRDRYGFVPTGSELHEMLKKSTDWGKPGHAVLRLMRHPGEDGKNWLEITELLATEWWPENP
ncbi:hypothetical protein [Luteolibacter sp. Populi]|uniref:hypothetical protein n=1 Tax=Luteolibacter sp. Populi TaxID=3230487 RepID=UPI003466314E